MRNSSWVKEVNNSIMGSELQATIDISLELHKFYNVDLFQRGFYQIRSSVKSSSKYPSKVEVSLSKTSNSDVTSNVSNGTDGLPSIINGCAVSKTFPILYRNEEVALYNMAQFRVHVIVETGKMEEMLAQCDLHLNVELWYSENNMFNETHSGESVGKPGEAVDCVSRRQIQLNFQPCRGLHCHQPVLFDYFHLSAVSITLHAALTSLHQPYISPLKNGTLAVNGTKSKQGRSDSRKHSKQQPTSTIESIFFGNGNSSRLKGNESFRMIQARKIHLEILTLLLSAFESLQTNLISLSGLLSENDRPDILIQNCAKRFEKFSTQAKNVMKEDEFVTQANSDMSQLCGELIILWNVFLNTVQGKYRILQYLARCHHLQRVRRFSEAFFLVENPRKSALECCDSKYQEYACIAESLRSSRYLNTLPNLAAFCPEVDGTVANLPVIFEDIYMDDSQSGRRHSIDNSTKRRLREEHNEDGYDDELLSLDEVLGNQTPKKKKTQSVKESSKRERPFSVPSLKKQDGDTFSLCDLTSEGNGIRMNSQMLPESPSYSSGYLSQESLLQFKKDLDALVHTKSASKKSPKLRSDLKYLKNKLKPHTSINNNNVTSKSKLDQNNTLPKSSKDNNGFSHLEWSASVPYNLAEEPDEVRGMKHSHSCQSVSGMTLEDLSVQKSAENSPAAVEKLTEIAEDPVQLDTSIEDPEEALESSALEITFSEDATSIDQTIKELEKDFEAFTSSTDFSKPAAPSVQTHPKFRQSQAELIKKLDQVRLESRSVILRQGRPRAKSEEAYKYPPDMRPRARMSSEGDESSKPKESPKIQPNALNAPNLVRNLTNSKHDEEKHRNNQSTVLPPEGFRDDSEHKSEVVMTNGDHDTKVVNRLLVTKKSSNDHKDETKQLCDIKTRERVFEKASQIQKNLEERMEKRKSQILNMTSTAPSNLESNTTIPTISEEDKEVFFPNKGREKEVKLSQLEEERILATNKSVSFESEYLLVESTGDYLETKSLPRPKKSPKRQSFDVKPSSAQDDTSFCDVSNTLPYRKPHNVPPLSLDSVLFGPKHMLLQAIPPPPQELVSEVDESTLTFVKAKEAYKKSMVYPGILYSDFSRFASSVPYFHLSFEYPFYCHQPAHLIVCVHGLDGNSADLRLIKTYLEMALPGHNIDFLMSEVNQGDTFSSFETMTDRLVDEIMTHLRTQSGMPTRISFVGHSLGCILIRSAITRPKLSHLVPYFHTYLALSGPHLGSLYNNSGLVNMGMWFMQKWKKSGSLHQLSFKDATDIRNTFLYQLSLRSNLHKFKHVLLAGSTQDRYVPWHSARIELCKSAIKDSSVTGSAYKEMVHNILSPIVNRGDSVTLARYDIHHALPTNTNALIGRAAHIAVLDSELFIEKFLIVSALKYFY